ncbi:LpxL/LpxP family acyltransferase [Azohydromonas caseinilytica]|uniref:Lipid A biosynthesis acyltransferase n=1 Tax=Azohydromonas caseinilytica TaxID=2728836 RepID=A0A848F4E9_9BURK|nr:lipid A biosynthesis acyltransferase [Azohydromonas caseinilytica]NML13595.1 lipid A biosynthesis acyltransferase [Azohydromonas caseinilytica]
MSVGAKLGIGLLRLVYRLPLGVQAALGRGLGALGYALAGSRRRIALRNVALCFPHLDAQERRRLVREHFGWLFRSLIERGLLWYAPAQRLRKLIHVEGDVGLAERSPRPVMWLVPHFVGLDVAGVATQLFQKQKVGSIYQAQSNPVWDAEIRKGRLRFGQGDVFARSERALPLVRAIMRGWAFFNLPDMDFGIKDAAFVPFFDVPAATLLAPARMARSLDMVVQPVVVEMLPGGQGYKVKFLPPWDDWPTGDLEADAASMNRWIEEEIRHCPAQYLWVHKRFKTRPPGQPSLYG